MRKSIRCHANGAAALAGRSTSRLGRGVEVQVDLWDQSRAPPSPDTFTADLLRRW
jgi:hypothetical protein